jgi:hypothetical protein
MFKIINLFKNKAIICFFGTGIAHETICKRQEMISAIM